MVKCEIVAYTSSYTTIHTGILVYLKANALLLFSKLSFICRFIRMSHILLNFITL